jgi:hypothetical protein
MHVAGFTKHPSSGVDPAKRGISSEQILQRNRGTFLAKNGKDFSRYLCLIFSKGGHMTLNFGGGLSKDRNAAANEAMVLSVDADSAPDTLRVSLQWQGDHDIADFDLQRFGKVLQIQDETEHTGWAIIERRFHARIAHTLPGWALHESVCPLKAGDTIPLRRDLE